MARCAGLAVWLAAGAIAAAAPAPAPAQEKHQYTGWSASVPTSTPRRGEENIQATVLKPDGAGPFPAVVMLHDCSGLGVNSSGAPMRWSTLLVQQGYVIIIPDSFAPRGFPEGICSAPADTSADKIRDVSTYQRGYDAYAALAYLRTMPYVDGEHIGVMGGSHGGGTTLVAMSAPSTPDGPMADVKKHGFAAGVALYPACGDAYGAWAPVRQTGFTGPVIDYEGTYRPIAPLLILAGELDDWTPARDCQALAERAGAAGYPVTLKVYPGAQHSFDSSYPVRFNAQRRNINSPTGLGATIGGNPEAWRDAIEQVTAFFARYLKPG